MQKKVPRIVPCGVAMRVQLGGGTDINRAVAYGQGRVAASEAVADEAAVTAAASIDPISDIHGNSEYRRKLVASLVRRAVLELKNGA